LKSVVIINENGTKIVLLNNEENIEEELLFEAII
jgi:hypothetical protein